MNNDKMNNDKYKDIDIEIRNTVISIDSQIKEIEKEIEKIIGCLDDLIIKIDKERLKEEFYAEESRKAELYYGNEGNFDHSLWENV